MKEGVVPRAPLVVGDEVVAAANSDSLAQLKLTLKLAGPVQEEALLLQLNGEALTNGEFVTTNAEKSKHEINYLLSTPPLKTGENFIEMSLNGTPTSRVELCVMRLKVAYKANG